MKPALPITAALMLSMTAAAADFCITPNTTIPDNGTEIEIPVLFIASANETVGSIELDLLMSHDWVGDLLIKLRSPDGTIITLLDRSGIPSIGFPGPFGCGGQDISCTFSDTASIPAESICSTTLTPVIAGPVIPSMPLNAFNSETASGTWTLLVSDHSQYDTGSVLQVCLSIATNSGCPADLTGDGVLDFFDISAFLTAFGNQDPIADFSNDGSFDFFDISAFLAAYSTGCP